MIKTSNPVSGKVIALSICIIGLMVISGCTATGEKGSIAGKYLDTTGSTSYLQLNPDGTCYLYPVVRGNFEVPGFNCTYTVHGNSFRACYPESGGICDNWTVISPGEISGPAGYHAKKAI
jgi:hypothetical protein